MSYQATMAMTVPVPVPLVMVVMMVSALMPCLYSCSRTNASFLLELLYAARVNRSRICSGGLNACVR
jgi:hypothetical protein